MPALITLPLEVLFWIFEFIPNPCGRASFLFHPLNSLAATCKHLDSAVEEYTRALLKQHANYAPQRKIKNYTSRRKWLAEICQLCYKKSKRKSTLWPTLTCCLACDKRHFPKVTMTNASKQYNLSKLDIFTPNRLHPTLHPLAHGEYSVMGGVATMIYEPDLVARRDYIHGRLSSVDKLDTSLRKRIRRHDGLIAHMEVAYYASRRAWYRSPRAQKGGHENSERASMETRESRDEFVRKVLREEWTAMRTEGVSEKTDVDLD
ncbi:uncharacterized protein EKO05_0001426 [Ascochyta rabiei]|uniref:Uncharacterized protein n=1 Tax=Didymella rabiei TaxID=5454 RepID=A0A163MC90_DIDRA|nr:uncharacterized protein EKO05_0001426 [Ascochyta rabiei]KZM28586.1 hypothetical protein ST47_g271 [Ascochyta rabiei]UPX10787.1 hypothetical protein EKO05_0001426 [Ascochyta rabiei]